jgi:hypothetical protein
LYSVRSIAPADIVALELSKANALGYQHRASRASIAAWVVRDQTSRNVQFIWGYCA